MDTEDQEQSEAALPGVSVFSRLGFWENAHASTDHPITRQGSGTFHNQLRTSVLWWRIFHQIQQLFRRRWKDLLVLLGYVKFGAILLSYSCQQFVERQYSEVEFDLWGEFECLAQYFHSPRIVDPKQ